MNSSSRFRSLWIASILLLGMRCEAEPQSRGTTSEYAVVEAFDLGEVHLLPGLMRSQFEEMKTYFMSMSSDDMLYEYRLSVGDPNPPGRRLGGWYRRVLAVTFPQWLSTYARLYAITGDSVCKHKAEYLFDEWWRCYSQGVASNIDGCATNKNNGHNDKLVTAMLDMYRYCGRTDALDRLLVFVTWAQDAMDRSRSFGDNGTEWYTAAWPLYQAYLLTGREEYRGYARFWEYTEYWDQFVTRPVTPFAKKPVTGMNAQWCHAYSHVNSFNAAAEAYRVRGDPYYLSVMRNAYEWLQKEQVFATGGYGPELEHLMPMDSVVRTLYDRTDHFETQCASWAALRFSQNLIELTGEARYGNWIERLAYNAVNATLPMTREGNVLYYSNYNIHGAMKLNRGLPEWTCCTGTRPLNVIQYHINTFFHDTQNIYVNLFTPSTVTWEHDQKLIKLTQSTAFPYAHIIKLTVSTANPDRFGVGIRIPDWIAGTMSARVNGQTVQGEVRRGWYVVSRRWRDGDRLELEIPQDFWVCALGMKEGGPAAIMHGPLVMALTTPSTALCDSLKSMRVYDWDEQMEISPTNSIGNASEWWSYQGMLHTNPDRELLASLDLKKIRSHVTPEDERLTFRLKSNPDVRLKPFMDLGEAELYYMYIPGGPR